MINFEKIVLGILFFIVVSVASLCYYLNGDISDNWVNVIVILGGYFTVRKVFSYFKNTDYYTNMSSNTITEDTSKEDLKI